MVQVAHGMRCASSRLPSGLRPDSLGVGLAKGIILIAKALSHSEYAVVGSLRPVGDRHPRSLCT